MYIKKAYANIVEDHDHDQDGWWVYLMPGVYVEYEGLHTIHEDTQKEALAVLYNYPIGRCYCEDCKREMERTGITAEEVDARMADVERSKGK